MVTAELSFLTDFIDMYICIIEVVCASIFLFIPYMLCHFWACTRESNAICCYYGARRDPRGCSSGVNHHKYPTKLEVYKCIFKKPLSKKCACMCVESAAIVIISCWHLCNETVHHCRIKGHSGNYIKFKNYPFFNQSNCMIIGMLSKRK